MPAIRPWTVNTVLTAKGWTHQILGARSGCSHELVAVSPLHFTERPNEKHATFDHQRDNADHIVACVNALDGINPAALKLFVADVMAVAYRLRIDGRIVDGITKAAAADILDNALATLAEEGGS